MADHADEMHPEAVPLVGGREIHRVEFALDALQGVEAAFQADVAHHAVRIHQRGGVSHVRTMTARESCDCDSHSEYARQSVHRSSPRCLGNAAGAPWSSDPRVSEHVTAFRCGPTPRLTCRRATYTE